jgi:GT2 family glycosyltransferase
VVDDCSTDDTAAVAAAAGARVIGLARRIGPAGARNRGAAAAASGVILFLDADVLVPPGLVEELGRLFDDPGTAAVQTVYTPACPAADLVSAYQNFYYHHSLARLGTGSVAVFATWCAAVRKSVFEDAGGFNDRIPDPTVEDEEFGYTLADAGRRIVLCRHLQVTHLACYSLGAFARRRFRMARAQAKSALRSVRDRLLLRYVNIRETGTHHSRWTVLAILLTLAAQVSLAAALAALASGLRPDAMLAASAGFTAASVACCLPLLRDSVYSLGRRVLPAFTLLCILDLAILGWGLVLGSAEFLLGRRY